MLAAKYSSAKLFKFRIKRGLEYQRGSSGFLNGVRCCIAMNGVRCLILTFFVIRLLGQVSHFSISSKSRSLFEKRGQVINLIIF